jgi:peptide/nickel transport system ATP-binding protein/oligopeptide transport system ATP-binding protein
MLVVQRPQGQGINMDRNILLSIENLNKHFKVNNQDSKHRLLKAVDNVSFSILEGETLGLVGESGCGKSTLGRTILNLYPPTSGDVIYKGTPLDKISKNEMKSLRRDLQVIFQDPSASLNPRKTIESIITEPFIVHKLYTKAEREARVRTLMKDVGLADYHKKRYPHELSGGQKQRVGIARALSLNPRFIVCDEAVSALDVSVQAQVLNLLQDLQDKYSLTYLFISHNLNVVYQVSDRVMVMYLGNIVEIAEYSYLYENPLHPYTKALLSAIPHVNAENRIAKIKLEGDVPNPINAPDGCKFCTRCPLAIDLCRKEEPELRELEPGHYAACHLAEN